MFLFNTLLNAGDASISSIWFGLSDQDNEDNLWSVELVAGAKDKLHSTKTSFNFIFFYFRFLISMFYVTIDYLYLTDVFSWYGIFFRSLQRVI